MHHFVAYHNRQRMGRNLRDGDPFSVLTNKPVQHLPGNTIWFVEGEISEQEHKQFLLSSWFLVDEIGESRDTDFRFFASGKGSLFEPAVPLNDQEWFPGFFKSLGHFGLGLRDVTDARFIDELYKLAEQAGLNVKP